MKQVSSQGCCFGPVRIFSTNITCVPLMKNCHVFIQDYKRLHGLLIRTLVTPLFACYRKSIAINRKISLSISSIISFKTCKKVVIRPLVTYRSFSDTGSVLFSPLIIIDNYLQKQHSYDVISIGNRMINLEK